MLHKLDVYIAERKDRIERDNEGKAKYSVNPIYHASSNRIYRLKVKALSSPKPLDTKIVEEIKYAKNRRRGMKSLIYNSDLSKIEYVRYADD